MSSEEGIVVPKWRSEGRCETELKLVSEDGSLLVEETHRTSRLSENLV